MYNVKTIEQLVNTELVMIADNTLSGTEVLSAINDGYKEVAALAGCIENVDTVLTVSGSNSISYSGNQLNRIELASTHKALVKILPEAQGLVELSGNNPQYWFPWDHHAVIIPVPQAAYTLNLFISDYPSVPVERQHVIYFDTPYVLWKDANGIQWYKTHENDYPSEIPSEFQYCVAMFVMYVLSLNLKRWTTASSYYNLYISSLQSLKEEYMKQRVETTVVHQLPDQINHGG
jgi:hypothetical protein